MQNVLRAERDGTVKKIHASAGATLAVDALFVQPVWSVNHPGWVLFCRLNYADAPADPAKQPVSSDLVLWDVAAGAHHGIPSHDNVTENVAGVFEHPVGFWENLPAEYSLGYYRGKAPFTVQIEDDRIREEMTWDFGDGAPRVQGRTARADLRQEGDIAVVPLAMPIIRAGASAGRSASSAAGSPATLRLRSSVW